MHKHVDACSYRCGQQNKLYNQSALETQRLLTAAWEPGGKAAAQAVQAAQPETETWSSMPCWFLQLAPSKWSVSIACLMSCMESTTENPFVFLPKKIQKLETTHSLTFRIQNFYQIYGLKSWLWRAKLGDYVLQWNDDSVEVVPLLQGRLDVH